MIMFDDIRNFIGDRNFFNSLKNYYKKYGGKNATPENLIDVFEDTSNKRLKSIFTSYIDGTAIIGNVSNKEN
jgi:aminopeptidase N